MKWLIISGGVVALITAAVLRSNTKYTYTYSFNRGPETLRFNYQDSGECRKQINDM